MRKPHPIRSTTLILLGAFSAASPAMAGPLTCGAFKDRLGGALVAAGDAGAEAPAFKEQRATDGGGSHANWDTSVLSGSLSCGAADVFQEFYVSLNVTSRERFAEQLKRLVSLDGAAICTLATAAPGACVETGKVALQDALGQMGSGFKRRIPNPNGISSRPLWADMKAEVTAAPSLITFSLAATATPDANRRSLPVPAPSATALAPTP